MKNYKKQILQIIILNKQYQEVKIDHQNKNLEIFQKMIKNKYKNYMIKGKILTTNKKVLE